MVIEENQKDEIINLFARHVSSGKVDYFTQAGIDFVAGEREGIYLCDIDGKRLINCHSNGGVFNLGHRNPRDHPRPAGCPGRIRYRQPPPDQRSARLAGRAPGSTLAR